jgi:Uma2 family endonuclease
MSAVIGISSQTQLAPGTFDNQNPKLRQITVAEYDLMIERGIFDENDQIELLNEVIIEKMPKGKKHFSASDRASKVFYRDFGNDVIIRNQNPIWLDEFSELEPDVVLAKFREDVYENSHPTPEEILLILKIADSILGYDRNTKGAAYSRAGIRQYILLHVQEKTLEDYRQPSSDGFQSKHTYRNGQSFNLVAFPEIFIR